MCQKKIMRKRSHESFDDEPPKKKLSKGGNFTTRKIIGDEVLTDLSGKQWKVGKVIGHGGFGEIFTASDQLQGPVKNDAPYVVKIESHSNGPLFVEVNCFLRIAKSELITQWKQTRKINFLGMPHYIASGSHKVDDERLRFLILPRYNEDLEKIFLKSGNKFNLKTVIVICTQILDVLEYIHSKGYVHCDIKASNIMYSSGNNNKYINHNSSKTDYNIDKLQKVLKSLHVTKDWYPKTTQRLKKPFRKELFNRSHYRNLRVGKTINYKEYDIEDETEDEYLQKAIHESLVPCHEIPIAATKVENIRQKKNSYKNGNIYLVDYGLAMKYRLSDGQHRQYCNDERKAHAGTILFCSLDAHLGAQSRRSDLESLGYNMIYWLTSKLPWEEHVEYPETVQAEKSKYFQNLHKFLTYCFGEYPPFLYDYFQYVKDLTFEAKPDYVFCKNLLLNALHDYGYKNDGCLDFDNLEGWGKTQKRLKKNYVHKTITHNGRKPLTSNTLIIKKTGLRGRKNKKNGKKKLNWFNVCDPEEILRQSNKIEKNLEIEHKPRCRRNTDTSENPLQNLDIWKLNPTYAMLDVFNKSRDRNGNYNHPLKNGKSDSFISENHEGYTPAMNWILSKMKISNKSTSTYENSLMNRRSKSIKSSTKKHNEIRRSKTSQNYIKDVKITKPKPVKVVRRYGLRG